MWLINWPLCPFSVHKGGERQVEMVVQVEAADHTWVWLYIVLQLDTGEYPINSHNYVIRYKGYQCLSVMYCKIKTIIFIILVNIIIIK